MGSRAQAQEEKSWTAAITGWFCRSSLNAQFPPCGPHAVVSLLFHPDPIFLLPRYHQTRPSPPWSPSVAPPTGPLSVLSHSFESCVSYSPSLRLSTATLTQQASSWICSLLDPLWPSPQLLLAAFLRDSGSRLSSGQRVLIILSTLLPKHHRPSPSWVFKPKGSLSVPLSFSPSPHLSCSLFTCHPARPGPKDQPRERLLSGLQGAPPSPEFPASNISTPGQTHQHSSTPLLFRSWWVLQHK